MVCVRQYYSFIFENQIGLPLFVPSFFRFRYILRPIAYDTFLSGIPLFVLHLHMKLPTSAAFPNTLSCNKCIKCNKVLFRSGLPLPFRHFEPACCVGDARSSLLFVSAPLGCCRKRPLGNALQPLTDVGNARKKEKRANILITYPPYHRNVNGLTLWWLPLQ